MRKKDRSIPVRAVLAIASVLMGIQILLGFVWMLRNFTALPSFGDSAEYLNLSETLVLDEYRPVLYPLILRFVCAAASTLKAPYQSCMYVLQTLASLGALLYGVCVIDKALLHPDDVPAKRWGARLFLALYLMTIPMITFMNFCVLTDSLATSVLVLFLSSLIRMGTEERVHPGNYVLMGVSVIAESLLRADRLYSCLLLVVIAFLAKLVRTRRTAKECRKTAVAMLCVCLSATGIVRGVSALTQTPGIHGRVRTNLEFVLLDRIVWPNMAANYKSFPQEIRDVIPRKAARKFDKHNNNVMYQMAPLVEEKCGEEKAREMYRTMAGIVFSNQPQKVLADIGEDIAAMFFTPVSSLLNAKGLCAKGDAWNVHCMSTVTPGLTRRYNSWYQYMFLILAVLGLISMAVSVFAGKRRGLGRLFRVLLPYFGMSDILTLWFSLGDGAPPNDRYAMIIYLFWSLLVIGLLVFREYAQTQDHSPQQCAD